jgi:hypothetical protein
MVLYWAKVVALLAVVVFLGFGSYFEWQLTQSSKQITQQASSVLSQASNSLTNLDKNLNQIGSSASSVSGNIGTLSTGVGQILVTLNKPCIPAPCGTLQDVAKTLNTIRLTAGNVDAIVSHEDKNLTNLDAQETQLFQDTHTVIAGFTPIQNNLDKTILDIDQFIISPDLTGTIHNVNTTTGNLAASSTDFQNKFHSFLYPPPCKGIRCHIGEVIQGIKLGSEFAEPAYWGYELFTAVH